MARFVAVEELFKGCHFDQEIVVVCVRWYLSFKLSYRDLVAMMGERGVDLAHTTILRWHRRGPRSKRPRGGATKHHNLRRRRPDQFNGFRQTIIDHLDFRLASHILEEDACRAYDTLLSKMPMKVNLHHRIGGRDNEADTQRLH